MIDRSALVLFAGGGLADLGIRAAGWRTAGAVEYDAGIAAIYERNHGLAPVVARVQDLDYTPWRGVDAIWASPSCVRASVANQNAGECSEDVDAAEAIIRCLRDTECQAFALENVRGYAQFESFRLILAYLRENGWRWAYGVECAADYGVPQTRRRLILRARRDSKPIQEMTRTHSRTGSLFEMPWVGWYEALEDLLPTLPVSQLANWQLKRLPAEWATMLVSNGGKHEETMTTCRAGAPACAVTGESSRLRAIICGGANTSDEQAAPGVGVMDAGDPAMVVAPNSNRRRVMVGCSDNTARPLTCRDGGKPAATVLVHSPRHPAPSVLLIADQHRQPSADEGEPAFTIRAGGTEGGRPHAIIGATVLKLTPRALARLQGVPDTYWLPENAKLACRVIGNGVPPALARAAMESLR